MKRLISLLIVMAAFFTSKAQLYNPSLHTVTNKALGVAQANPTDARTFYYDATLFKYRPYQSTAEVLTYLNLQKYRVGNFPVIINLSGTLQPDGSYTDSTVSEYWFEGCVADTCLKIKSLGGGGGGSGTVTSITGGFGLDGGTIVTSGTFSVDTANEITSKVRGQKIADSLGAIIATKGVGTVTDVDAGWGATALPAPITTSGWIGVDSNSVTSRVWHQKGLDSLNSIKQNTLVSGTNIKTVNTASLLGSGDLPLYDNDEWRKVIAYLGGTSTNLMPIGWTSLMQITTALGLPDNVIRVIPFYVREDKTITGASWFVSQVGNFTADQTNGLALYTFNTGTDVFTKVAETANDGDIWKRALGKQSEAFTSPYSATAGTILWLAPLYNYSAQTTQPQVRAAANPSVDMIPLQTTKKLWGQFSTQNSFAATYTLASLVSAVSGAGSYFELY